MYIGGTDNSSMHHLFSEVIDNAMDEAVANFASFIEVKVEKGNIITVYDNGRGIPIDPHPNFPNKSALATCTGCTFMYGMYWVQMSQVCIFHMHNPDRCSKQIIMRRRRQRGMQGAQPRAGPGPITRGTNLSTGARRRDARPMAVAASWPSSRGSLPMPSSRPRPGPRRPPVRHRRFVAAPPVASRARVGRGARRDRSCCGIGAGLASTLS